MGPEAEGRVRRWTLLEEGGGRGCTRMQHKAPTEGQVGGRGLAKL